MPLRTFPATHQKSDKRLRNHRRLLVLLILLGFLLPTAQLAFKPTRNSLAAPLPATTAGARNLVFEDNFDNLSGVDLRNSGASGFKWYLDVPFDDVDTSAQDLSVQNSVLTINQSRDNFNYSIGTSNPKTKVGNAFRYGYFEARIAFDPRNGATSAGWPSFWMMSRDHLELKQTKRMGELDIFEAYHDPSRPSGQQFYGTVHDWLGASPRNIDRGSYGNNVRDLSPSTDLQQFHVYGVLWTPGQATWYFDGQEVLTQKWSATSVPDPNPGGHPVGTYSVLDQETNGETLILGTGKSYPMRVDWVRIWQTGGSPSCNCN